MTRTLITGVGGFTGRYLTSLLASRGHEVHGVVHTASQGPVANAAKIHVANLVDHNAVQQVVDDVRPEHVVHLAGVAFVAHGNIEEMYSSNIVGSRNLLDALANSKKLPVSILYASSANVYGNARDGILDEDCPLAPANDYGVTKVAAEHVAGLYRSRLPIIVVRPFNYTGKGQSENFLIPKIVRHVRDRSAVIELGNVDVARDFTDVRVVVDAYARLIESTEATGGTFNVCSGRAVSISELLVMVEQVSGHNLEVRINPAFVRHDEVKTLAGSSARLQKIIGDLKKVPLRETLRWMLAE